MLADTICVLLALSVCTLTLYWTSTMRVLQTPYWANPTVVYSTANLCLYAVHQLSQSWLAIDSYTLYLGRWQAAVTAAAPTGNTLCRPVVLKL